MAVSPKRNGILLQFLHHFKTHTLTVSARFQYMPKKFAQTLLEPGRYGLNIFPRVEENSSKVI